MTFNVVSAFPGTGKSTIVKNAKEDRKILDSDSSTFPKDGFPANYLEHIKAKIADGYDLLVPSHEAVRNALTDAEIPYILVYPKLECKEEYLQRYRDRGNKPEFVQMMDEKWEEFIGSCEQQEGCFHIQMAPGQYLSEFVS